MIVWETLSDDPRGENGRSF
uniref:Uncharacterized protein n=1 Tax=Anguilla anguilla TaxID=7936 RepID=A0A0E9PCQ7_ANGAN